MKKHWRSVLALLLCVVMLIGVTACGGEKEEKDPEGGKKPSGEINAVEYGCDNTGKKDNTQLMMKMHKEGAEDNKVIYYPNGTYLFNGVTLDFSSGVRFESQDGVLIRNRISDEAIINYDDFGNFIGLMHNHLEQKIDGDIFTINGNLVSPPLADANYETKVDFVPFWYNDFGLQGSSGSKTWYDWSWNHHDCQAKNPENDPYDPNLHPLLGWYRGDDPIVLDWICYWLQMYGMKNAILLGGVSEGWDKPQSGNYWVYEILHEVPNARQMKFAFQVSSSSYGSSYAEYRDAWFKSFEDFYFNEEYKDNVYCIEKDGKRYAVISFWDEHAISYSLHQDYAMVKQLYYEVVDAFKAHGYDGVSLWARTPIFAGEGGATHRAEMLDHDILWYASDYPSNAVGPAATYPAKVDSFLEMTDTSVLYAVATGLDTHTPHPSNWSCPGTNATDFGRWIEKAMNVIDHNDKVGKAITCYNVSEWAEGGPGLVPTVQSRFGYLEAIRDQIVKK